MSSNNSSNRHRVVCFESRLFLSVLISKIILRRIIKMNNLGYWYFASFKTLAMFVSSSGDLFVDEDFITVSAIGGAPGGPSGGGQLHIAPGKIDERVRSILEEEDLNRVDMEKSWKEDVHEVQEEANRRTDSVSDKQPINRFL